MKATLLVILCAASALALPYVNDAPLCDEAACALPGCRCSGTKNPIDNADDPAPQLIAITISESVVQTPLIDNLQPLFFDRTNPDGGKAGLTFYVNHEYTDYTLVQDMYLRGYEIGVHSITKEPNQTYWRTAPLELLQKEFCGQKEILQDFAQIPPEDITGARTPQLQLEGDVSIDAYVACELSYDNSWPALTTNRVLPYTLDYLTTQQCTATNQCPKEAHAGFWIAPITDIRDADGVECNSLATCKIEGSADDISNWLLGELDNVKKENRAPLILRLDSYWFNFTKNSYDGFMKFLDAVGGQNDVFLVTVTDVLNWIKTPVPLSQYKSPDYSERYAECLPVTCHLKRKTDGIERNMGSCIPCPNNYPWLDNPDGS